MATITSWAGNIADIGPMYPFVGTEMTLFIIGVVLWLVWHFIQALEENDGYASELRKSSEILSNRFKK